MMLDQIKLLALLLSAIIIVVCLGSTLLDPYFGSNIAGWIQTGITVISFPIILFELDQIRRTLNKKPHLEVGLVNMNDLPFSKVRCMHEIPEKTTVSDGYPHFYLVLRNRGAIPARYVKIYLEHTNRENHILPPPLVKISEFTKEKPSFVAEHNFDFVFRAGTEWIINPDDIEPFGFHIATSIIIDKNNRSALPPPCEIFLDCTIWAEGLQQPLKKKLVVRIIKS